MQTPKDSDGVRTEAIMAVIKEDVFNGDIDTALYNKLFSAVYKGSKRCTVQNVMKGLKELKMGE